MKLLRVLDTIAALPRLFGKTVEIHGIFFARPELDTIYFFEPRIENDAPKEVVGAILQWPGLITYLDVPRYHAYLRHVPGSVPYSLGPIDASVIGVIAEPSVNDCAFDIRSPTLLELYNHQRTKTIRITKDDVEL